MRTLCDVCEKAAAILFCAADEAALCHACDEKVHLCNKLANRHVRVGLADPSAVTRCDICENAPAFFYCEVDGTSLCQQCDMIVHVGGKRTHGRYLLFRQRVEFPGDNLVHLEEAELQADDPGEVRRNQNQITPDSLPNHEAHPVDMLGTNVNINGKMDMANEKPDLPREAKMAQTSNNQMVEGTGGTKNETAGFLPIGSFNQETRKL